MYCSIATAVAGTGRQCACIRSLAVATPGRARWTSRRRWDVPVRTLMQATLSCSSCCSFRADKERTTMHFLLISGLLSLVIGHGSATPTPLATDSDAQMPAASVSFLVNSDRDRDQQRPAVDRKSTRLNSSH